MHIKRKKIRKVIRALKEGEQFISAVRGSGIQHSTWYAWEKKNPRLEKLRRAAEERCEDFRNDLVEKKFLDRFKDGTATPTDFIFYLTNRLPLRWKDRRAVVNNTNVNTVKVDSSDTRREFANDTDREHANRMRQWLTEHRNGHAK